MNKRFPAFLTTLFLAVAGLTIFWNVTSSSAAQITRNDHNSNDPAAQQAASIAFTITVGTDPATCAMTKRLTLPVEGGEVTYCYRVVNSGNITLTRHTLVDDLLGTILSDFPFPLSPAASVFLTRTALITTTTVNTATWTAFNPGPIDTASGTDSSSVVIRRWLYLPLITKTSD